MLGAGDRGARKFCVEWWDLEEKRVGSDAEFRICPCAFCFIGKELSK
jgi:hypothetical protein